MNHIMAFLNFFKPKSVLKFYGVLTALSWIPVMNVLFSSGFWAVIVSSPYIKFPYANIPIAVSLIYALAVANEIIFEKPKRIAAQKALLEARSAASSKAPYPNFWMSK